MKMSLKKQIVLAFLILILTITSVDILCNRYLLDDYYLNNKETILLNTANKINKNSQNLQDIDFLNEIEKDCRIHNLSLLVATDQESPFIYFYNKEDAETIMKRLQIHKQEDNLKEPAISIVKNTSLNINYLEACGKLDNGYYYLIKTPIDSIKETAALSTVFLLYVLIFLLPFSIMIIIVMVDRITQPLTKLTTVSKKISNLDFSEQCSLEGSTEIIELGKNFNKMSNDLESTIGQLKTANVKLQQDLDKKEQIEEMRKEFLSSVSHELKTPIAIISGYAESLKDSVDDPEDIEFFADTIYEETQKLSKMVKDILEINKLESQPNNANITNINLFNLITQITTPMQKVIEEKNITFNIKVPEKTKVWTDANLLAPILSNYITNAIDHVNDNGSINIFITKYKDKAKISVYNSGNQIEDEHIERIWDKFYKADKSRHREFGGTGLGLSIVKSYAKLLNQEYGVENKFNGVEFYITTEISQN